MELMVFIAIVGLVCFLPVQLLKAVAADDRRMVAELHDEDASFLEEIASDPAAWIDRFRPELLSNGSLGQTPGYALRRYSDSNEMRKRYSTTREKKCTSNGSSGFSLTRSLRGKATRCRSQDSLFTVRELSMSRLPTAVLPFA